MTAPFAAVDMGSNSFRLEVAQLDAGRYRRLLYAKEPVRLGGGLSAEGLLNEAAMQRGLDCLARFREQLAGYPDVRLRAVATATLREARNRDEFAQRALEALGHPIEVISGREEARLIYVGVGGMQPASARRLVIDIGGRSTEIILGAGNEPELAESFPVGCVSMTQRYFGDGQLRLSSFAAAQVAAGVEFEEAFDLFTPGQWKEALGSSGTAGAVSEMLAQAGVTDGSITPTGLQWLIGRFIEAGHLDRLSLPGLKPDRVPVIAGGVAILAALLDQFRIEVMQPARGALRQGVIFELHDRLELDDALGVAHDRRTDTVARLQERFGVDGARAKRVREGALALLERLLPDASEETRTELAWACELHEIGMAVSHHDYHRHGAYLMAHLDAPGFSQSVQRRLSELILGQRGGLRKVEHAMTRAEYPLQLLSLRLALIECHDRSAPDSGHLARSLRVRSTRGGAQVDLTPSDSWRRSHPRTAFLLDEEARAWRRGLPLQVSLK